jgi:ABC-type lipoprotein export system ATPase subunit
MIHASRLRKIYGDASSGVKAIDGVNLKIDSGQRVALLGRSGSGKSTLMNILAGLDRPTGGELIVAGKSLLELSPSEIAHYRRTCVGVVFQSFQLIAQRTAIQNVELPLILSGMNAAKRKRRVNECLERVSIAHRRNHLPAQMSGGEQQRVAIARAIVSRPPLLLADEPTGNLDSQTADQVTRLMLDVVAENNATLVLITHDQTLAETCATRTIHMQDGKFISDDVGIEVGS